MDPVAALSMRLGASWWRQLVNMGVTDGDLRGAVSRGQVVTDGAGTYWLADADEDIRVAATQRARLTCCSAARRHGIALLHLPERPHIAVPRARPARTDCAVVHRVDTHGKGPVVPLLGALLTLVRCLPTVDAIVALDSAVHQKQVRVGALMARLRGPGSVEAKRRVGLIDGQSGSVIETVLRLALRQAGLSVESQVWIPRVGRVDFVVAGWLVVEVDGFEFHSTRDQYRVDRARANALAAQGYVLLRFTYEDVMHRLPQTLATVMEVLAQGRP